MALRMFVQVLYQLGSVGKSPNLRALDERIYLNLKERGKTSVIDAVTALSCCA